MSPALRIMESHCFMNHRGAAKLFHNILTFLRGLCTFNKKENVQLALGVSWVWQSQEARHMHFSLRQASNIFHQEYRNGCANDGLIR